MTPFGKLLKSLIADHFGTQLAFSNHVGEKNPWIYQIIHGDRTPALDRVERWGRELKQNGRELELFRHLAAIAHIPDREAQDKLAAILFRFKEVDRGASLRAEIAANRKAAEESRRGLIADVLAKLLASDLSPVSSTVDAGSTDAAATGSELKRVNGFCARLRSASFTPPSNMR